jgi:hypothetical protein
MNWKLLTIGKASGTSASHDALSGASMSMTSVRPSRCLDPVLGDPVAAAPERVALFVYLQWHEPATDQCKLKRSRRIVHKMAVERVYGIGADVYTL